MRYAIARETIDIFFRASFSAAEFRVVVVDFAADRNADRHADAADDAELRAGGTFAADTDRSKLRSTFESSGAGGTRVAIESRRSASPRSNLRDEASSQKETSPSSSVRFASAESGDNTPFGSVVSVPVPLGAGGGDASDARVPVPLARLEIGSSRRSATGRSCRRDGGDGHGAGDARTVDERGGDAGARVRLASGTTISGTTSDADAAPRSTPTSPPERAALVAA